MRRLTLLLLCALQLSLLPAQTTLNGAGATFPIPCIPKWFSEYHKLHCGYSGQLSVHWQWRRHPSGDRKAR